MTTRETSRPEPASWLYGSGGQLRAVWRIGVFVCVYFLVNGILEAVLTPVLSFVSAQSGNLLGPHEWVNFLSALVAMAVVLRQIDKQEWRHVGMQRSAWRAPELGQGFVLGGAAITVTASIIFFTGRLTFVPDPVSTLLNGTTVSESARMVWLASTLRIALLLAPAAMFEELIFRGYFWRVAEDSGGPRVALFFTSVLFGLAHVQNPGVSQLAITNVIFAGFALGLIRMRTDSLPAAWAAHFAWNWIMAAGLHVPVSGWPIATPGYRAVLAEPEWFSGGEWGPEGGIAASIVLVAVIAPSLYFLFSNRNLSSVGRSS